ncbi:NAD(P)H-quinone oxidoreductase subunit F [Phormidium yuhuli AB48]|uniref:NAD(P)H-quinone oxidoreductase subunit F n=1 Tax=Phormidium yuhuli AB48 TaxID=2940671 RepID=A0ABY5AU08_9CYAN|nr:NAD(P)H-quinone oxidoreductase subunit F [Phormidium yuhuli]USR92510.1 NAD(P)H-quinone oxidoreductase subunit F [Phormidium yuhuli AB48]
MSGFLLQTCWFVPLYGLIGAVLSLPWSVGMVRRSGPRPAAYLNLLMTSVAFLHGSAAYVQSWGQPPQQLVFSWLNAANLDLSLAIEISPLSLGAMGLVTGISLMSQLYALGYMEKDWSLARFFGLMGFFEAALSGIALSDSLLLSYGLLEMLTLSTYLLVGFWYAQPLVVTAARDAFLTKRVGDILLLMGLVALSSYGTGLTFSELEAWAETNPLPFWTATWLGLGLIAGPIGKCAQFPLNLWLDEAMEGPSPASIMRNSVVVSAGAYVLIRLQPVFTLSPVVYDALIIIGTITAIGGSLMCLAQIDLKRALSHSTSAYMGLVFIAVGLGQVDIALLLLLTHAIAKALIFSSVGSIILATNSQNITEMGGLWSRMPATTTAFVVGGAGLVSILPLGTFWTFRRWVNGFQEVSPGLVLILVLVNFLNAVSLTRVFRCVFLGEHQAKSRRSPEAPWTMAVPMVSLIIVTLLVPLMLQHWQLLLTWDGPWAFSNNPLIQFGNPLLVVSGLAGIIVGSIIPLERTNARSQKLSVRFWQDLLAYDFYIDRVYRVTVVAFVSGFSRLASAFDRYIVDGAVNLVGWVAIFSGQALKYSISGQSQSYVLTILAATGILVFLALWGF